MAATRRKGRRATARPRLRWGRFLVLALVLVAAALYAEPLRAFFVQQDRYEKASTALASAQADNQALHAEIERLGTDSYVAERALSDLQMVPRGMQAFVVKGLPGESAAPGGGGETVVKDTLSPLDRLTDLWRTLSE